MQTHTPIPILLSLVIDNQWRSYGKCHPVRPAQCHPTPLHSTYPIPSFPPLSLFPFFSPPLPLLHFPLLPPLISRPHTAAKESGEHLSSPSGSGQSPATKRFLKHFQLFNGPLVTGKTTKNWILRFRSHQPQLKKIAGKPGVPLCHPSPTVTWGGPPPPAQLRYC